MLCNLYPNLVVAAVPWQTRDRSSSYENAPYTSYNVALYVLIYSCCLPLIWIVAKLVWYKWAQSPSNLSGVSSPRIELSTCNSRSSHCSHELYPLSPRGPLGTGRWRLSDSCSSPKIERQTDQNVLYVPDIQMHWSFNGQCCMTLIPGSIFFYP